MTGQSQLLDQSNAAQSNYMAESSSIMNMSAVQPQNQNMHEESMITQVSQPSNKEAEMCSKAIMKMQEYYDIIEQLERFTREGKFN